jgi:uncharacterized protein involved in exopolysaccharide biosynthesis
MIPHGCHIRSGIGKFSSNAAIKRWVMNNTIEKNIDVTLLLRALKRFWLLVAVTGVIGAVAGILLATMVVKPLYRSTALIFAWADIDKPIITSNGKSNASGDAAATGKNDEISFRMAQELATAKLRGFQLLSQQLTVGNLLMPDFEALLNSRKLRQKIDEKIAQLYPEKPTLPTLFRWLRCPKPVLWKFL